MAGLPDSLAIALWCVGSIWVVGLVAYFTDAGSEFSQPPHSGLLQRCLSSSFVKGRSGEHIVSACSCFVAPDRGIVDLIEPAV
jgi:hypothetical protein